jgi:ubiquinone/menaquinone biosynthesis C-methylase UbiE
MLHHPGYTIEALLHKHMDRYDLHPLFYYTRKSILWKKGNKIAPYCLFRATPVSTLWLPNYDICLVNIAFIYEKCYTLYIQSVSQTVFACTGPEESAVGCWKGFPQRKVEDRKTERRHIFMAIETPVHVNECGLPLNAIEWLVTHHQSKIAERERMIQDLHLKGGSKIIDAGCGPGLWTPLLAKAIGSQGRIIGVDLSAEALVTARQRGRGQWYEEQVCYKQSSLEHLPVASGSVHAIFSANVSQYLPEPVETFARLGHYLLDGGQLAIKDIDFGTLRFSGIDSALQTRVTQARVQWEKERVAQEYVFEDSWVGSKLANYMRIAGYEDVQEKVYTIVRHAPLDANFRAYLQGIGSWFVCEGAPFLAQADVNKWLDCFLDGEQCVLDQARFHYEETEYMVTGRWPSQPSHHFFDMHLTFLENR